MSGGLFEHKFSSQKYSSIPYSIPRPDPKITQRYHQGNNLVQNLTLNPGTNTSTANEARYSGSDFPRERVSLYESNHDHGKMSKS